MKCPVCNVDLQMTDRQGVEIDYCPQCRGVWLDRGELDKILDRASAPPYAEDRDYRSGPPSKDSDYPKHHGHKKKSIWKEMFDF
ncbi:MAG: zf-TFIIB domain-containing protein [Planctomycetaceae bacterium]